MVVRSLQQEHQNGTAIVLMSGGIDSMACAHFLLGQAFSVKGLFVDYGQMARDREEGAVSNVARALGLPLLRVCFLSECQYGPGEIPGRNGLLTMAALAISTTETRVIATGIHRGTTYYDCSPAFAERMDTLLREYTSGTIRYFAPFLWNTILGE